MGHVIWISGAAAAMAIVLGLSAASSDRSAGVEEQNEGTAYVQPAIAEPAAMTVGSAGSALATAAFGMSALQPETFNGELVFDIIEASPLADQEKSRLYASLRAINNGQTDMDLALEEIRIALAIE